jgi:hypothetical protein
MGQFFMSQRMWVKMEVSKKQSMAKSWWFTAVIPATQEVEVGGLKSKAGLGKKHKLLSEKTTEVKSG